MRVQAMEASSGFASGSMPLEEINILKTRVTKLEDFVCTSPQISVAIHLLATFLRHALDLAHQCCG